MVSTAVKSHRRFLIFGPVAGLVMLAAVSRVESKTALEECIDRAYVEANKCYMAAGDSWFKGALCDLALEVRLGYCVLK